MSIKKYRLKQRYPGLRDDMKVGDTVSESDCKVNLGCGKVEAYVFTGKIAPFYLPKSEVENSPEFWEEVKERDYEILKVKTTPKHPQHFKGTVNSHIFDFDKGHIEGLFKSHPNWWKIHSVKRLSDDEVFTIGDKIQEEKLGTFAFIDEFNISEHYGILVHATNGSYSFNQPLKRISKVKDSLFISDDGVSIYEGDPYFVPQKDDPDTFSGAVREFSARKTKDYSADNSHRFSTREVAERFVREQTKKPLFTTEDGIDIYEGDEYHIADPTRGYLIHAYGGDCNYSSGKRFSTHKKAEEYIEQNEPIYSKAEIRKAVNKCALSRNTLDSALYKSSLYNVLNL